MTVVLFSMLTNRQMVQQMAIYDKECGLMVSVPPFMSEQRE